MKSRLKKSYFTNCVAAKAEDIIDMIDSAREVTLKTFLRNCDCVELLRDFGYGKHLKISKEWNVKFYKSTYKGSKCYFMDHSCIEYVFV